VYETLAAEGVQSFVFGARDLALSTFSLIVTRGAKLMPFRTVTETLVNITTLAANSPAPSYLFFYFPSIDAMCHDYGPDSTQAHAEVDALMHALDLWFLRFTHNLGKRTLFVMTADHGHMSVSPKNTRYLNLEPDLKWIVPLLRTDARGDVLVPAGSPRDSFLYVRDEALAEAHARLETALEGYADVVPTQALLDAGYFGKPPVSAELTGRLGNLAILPHPNNCVWWYEPDRFEQRHHGHHGSLTPTEMEIPLALLELD
jgi:hypothetical protein